MTLQEAVFIEHAARVRTATVIGGANVDFKSQTFANAIIGTSNPGYSRTSAGGVGRNVAENLARLGVNTALITALGDDINGAWLRSQTASAGVDVRHVLSTRHQTGTYTALLDTDGEMIIAVAAMEAMDDISARAIDERADAIGRSDVVVLDCNIPEDALLRAAAIAHDSGARIVVDPVSVPKAGRMRAMLSAQLPIHTLTPNLDELRALTGTPCVTDDELAAAARQLHADGVEHVWIRLGLRGSVLISHGSAGATIEYIEPCPATLIDATGAGDAMLAGYVAALLSGFTESTATRYGRAAAAITIESESTVNPEMSFDMLAARVAACA